LSDIIDEYGVRRLYDERSTRDAGIVGSCRIICPCTRAVFILPLGNGDTLNLCCQCCLRSTNERRRSIVLEYIGICCHIGELCVLCIAHQSVGNIRCDIDRVLGLGIVVADIADVGNHPCGRGSQHIAVDLQDSSGNFLIRIQCCLSAASVLTFPCDSQTRGVECNIGLVKENDRRKCKICAGPAWCVGVRQHIRVFTLRLRQIGSDISRQLSLVCNVHEGLLAGS